MSNPTSNEGYLYVKFKGPAADEGMLNVAKAGRVLIALGKWKRHYKKAFLNKETDFNFKLYKIEKNCTELQIVVEVIDKVAPFGMAAAVMNLPGIKDFLKVVGTELGNQISLKIFSKGKNITESDMAVKNGKIYVKAVNTSGKVMEVEKKSLDFYRYSQQSLNSMYALEANNEESTTIGYYTPELGNKDVTTIGLNDKEAFVDEGGQDEFAMRMLEPFDESKAKEEKVVGQFIDHHVLAHKYKFSFQARKQQEDHGKQKILCIVDESQESAIIELMKPENRKNVCIKGKATRDNDGHLDKIKIEWFNEDPDYDPHQSTLL